MPRDLRASKKKHQKKTALQSETMSEAKKGELAIRDKAILHQQRRLKQATQFTHKDSADLLPLDGLKRLGTSKDLICFLPLPSSVDPVFPSLRSSHSQQQQQQHHSGHVVLQTLSNRVIRVSSFKSAYGGQSKVLQPHSIVQRRLLEGNITRLRGEARDPSARVRSPLADTKDGPADAEERSESTADDSTEERESLEESERSLRSDEEDDSSEAGGPDRRLRRPPSQLWLFSASGIMTPCCETEVKASINTGSQHNHISASCCQRLGLVPSQDSSPCGVSGSVTGLQLQLGTQTVQCSAYVKEDEASELCLGLQTLLELECCLDLSSRVLKLQGCDEELPFLNPSSDSQCQHDTNENL
ncbi:hypothetical protein L3Q82_009315 [Scortum barcoo]|uniref:Uncharacterized protein n=1 Tax=Scortum barcoo TaxID=214431 RepID=A0ACB8WG06_9TELE|nr:hypothetical protein L3Q82_009315 [Scortum barcoo]